MKKFHVVKEEYRKHKGVDIDVPKRSTEFSAGYDICISEDIVLNPMTLDSTINVSDIKDFEDIRLYLANATVVPSKVFTWTDIAVELDEDEFLMVVPRSGVGTKYGVQLSNTNGIIDSDYIDNKETGGNIGLSLKNFSGEEVVFKKGERIAQGIIVKYGKTTEDTTTNKRTGGFGSSGK